VLRLARQEAERLGHHYIGTEHILLGLAKEGDGVAARVLGDFGARSQEVQTAVEAICQAGPVEIGVGQLPFTPRTKEVLGFASNEAATLKHNYIGTEHLLLGLLCDDEGAAAQALAALGLAPETLREKALDYLGSAPEPVSGTPDDPDYETLVEQEAPHFFDRYQEWTRTTAIYPGANEKSVEAIVYCALKLGGESGEFLEKLGKLVRGNGFKALEDIDDDTLKALAKELGDVVWYIARAADELGLRFSDITAGNIAKLSSRKDRGVLHGYGDNR
jgi:NTP pyrophosphatase (non-canonical NTP hydrolase)